MRVALVIAVGLAGLPFGGMPAMSQDRVRPLPPPSSSRDRKAGQRAVLVGITWTLPERGEGVVVQRVRPESAAAEAGLRSGDILRVIDGQVVRGIRDAVRLLSPGKRVAIQYERDGRLWATTLSVPVGPLTADALPPPVKAKDKGKKNDNDDKDPEASSTAELPTPRVRPMLGVTVRSLTDAERARRGIPQSVRGLLITQVRPGTPAARYGLPLGGVILDVDGAAMSEPDDLIAVVRGAKLDHPILIRYWDRGEVYRKRVTLAPELLVPQSVLELEKQLGPSPLPPPVESSSEKSDELASLRKRVEELERQVEALTRRLERLEQNPQPHEKPKKEPQDEPKPKEKPAIPKAR